MLLDLFCSRRFVFRFRPSSPLLPLLVVTTNWIWGREAVANCFPVWILHLCPRRSDFVPIFKVTIKVVRPDPVVVLPLGLG